VSTSDIVNGTPDGAILEFDQYGTKTTFATGLTNNPRGLAFDASSNLFVAEVPGATTGDILEFTLGGTGTVQGIVPVSGGVALFASELGDAAGNGGAEFLAFAPPNTPIASNVTTAVALTFPEGTTAGTTTVAPIDPSLAGTLPSAFELTGGNPAFEITTTATYTTPIIIAVQVLSITDQNIFSNLQIFHGNGSS